jgi:hypothetical protein
MIGLSIGLRCLRNGGRYMYQTIRYILLFLRERQLISQKYWYLPNKIHRAKFWTAPILNIHHQENLIDLYQTWVDSLKISVCLYLFMPPFWSSCQSSWLQIQRSRVRSPALPDFLRSSGSGTGSTQPREDN